MQWGPNGIQNFGGLVKAQGARAILAFNEPDFASQSNIDPEIAAQLWKAYIQPLKSSGVKLVSPAVTSVPSGIPWLNKFLAACTGCTIDAIAVHWYGSGAVYFANYLSEVHKSFPSYPIWVAKFADPSSDEQVVANFLKQSVAHMDTLSWVEKYAWFAYFRQESNTHYNLLDASGNLNNLGKLYVTP